MAGTNGGVRVEGLAKVTRDLQSLGLALDDIKDAFAQIAAEGARLAASFAPRLSGRLAASVRGNRAKNKAVVSAGKARVAWAGSNNYGWPSPSKYQGKPRVRGGWPVGIVGSSFMQRADEAMRPRAIAELEQAIDRKIRERGLG